MKKISIAIDGPASSGKSTVAKILAKKLKYVYCDTGAMYRALTYLALEKNIDFENEKALVELCLAHTISFEQTEKEQLVFVDGVEVTEAIRQPNVTNAVSIVAKHAAVREKMVEMQQEIGQAGGVVMDGRDIGTAVLPDAEVKIFLVASVKERAERRYKENQEKGIATDFETLKKEIEHRDYLDSTREVSPLKQAVDAVKIDTTGMSIDEVVRAIEEIIATNK
ncbi:cytidylate kinase [Enterococcus moraviensis ATCC BAA-383]|uniref:Cytidylate kinase n=1 Tax=Enterococcus moraviensis ATCC BAA-383 TaxID=1158609 RepID=R2QYN9_9ENTE|nr:(d)CMP kinase [Enterococcus moraviensis]EOI00501.1 cytidylate kinase [Enterococcus moraviensis ATCC BAA-383]EOT73270.1 cytidylate kinase [Enterococcus moraviensis ATCC BAA-383]OJG68825.1 cytidylate kinase [Enterococcus moraviensis]